jgi:hypothetical protein
MRYEKFPDKNYGDENNRFALLVKGKKPLIVFGVNPSTADDRTPDKTIMRVINFAKQYDCDGWIMLNIYAQRSTNPSKLHKEKEFDPNLHSRNMTQIKEILIEFPNHVLCAAWGTSINKRKYLRNCLKEISQSVDGNWKTIGIVTKHGHPKHPSRLAKNLDLQSFDIKEYLR